MTEIWKPIKGYEGRYEVSNLGNVRSLNWRKSGLAKKLTPAIDRYGYLQVCLSKNGKQFNGKVHRLVADAFLPTNRNDLQVNHKDEDKTNNRASNLEWMTPAQNVNHGTRNTRMSAAKINGNAKAVKQLDLDGKIVRVWPSMSEVRRVFRYDTGLLSLCCRGIKHTAYGYRWEYAKEGNGNEPGSQNSNQTDPGNGQND